VWSLSTGGVALVFHGPKVPPSLPGGNGDLERTPLSPVLDKAKPSEEEAR